MFSLTNRIASSVRQRNVYVHKKNGTGFVIQHCRFASVKLTPNDVNKQLNYIYLTMNIDLKSFSSYIAGK